MSMRAIFSSSPKHKLGSSFGSSVFNSVVEEAIRFVMRLFEWACLVADVRHFDRILLTVTFDPTSLVTKTIAGIRRSVVNT